MKNQFYRAAAFLLSLVLINWSAWGLFVENSSEPIDAPPEKHEGFATRVFRDDDGSQHKYIVFTPYGIPKSERPPVILFLNGVGENGDDGLMQIFQNFGLPIWEMKRHFPFVAVAPQCPQGGSWAVDGPTFQRALKILDLVIKNVNADPDRIYLTGVSAGGTATWLAAHRYPERLAAIVPVASLGTSGLAPSIAKTIVDANIGVWEAHNEFDQYPEVIEFNRTIKREILQAGGSPQCFEYSAIRHDAWNRTYRSPALYEWLLQQSRAREKNGRFKLFEASEILNAFDSGDKTAWTTADDESIQAPVTGTADATLLSRERINDFELHAEFQGDLQDCCGIIAQDSNANAGDSDGWKVLLCGAMNGSGGALSADESEWLGDLHPLAQRSLEANRWNDVRVQVKGNRLLVHVNGWEAINVENARFASGPKRIGLLQNRNSAKPARWRLIRLRSAAIGG